MCEQIRSLVWKRLLVCEYPPLFRRDKLEGQTLIPLPSLERVKIITVDNYSIDLVFVNLLDWTTGLGC